MRKQVWGWSDSPGHWVTEVGLDLFWVLVHPWRRYPLSSVKRKRAPSPMGSQGRQLKQIVERGKKFSGYIWRKELNKGNETIVRKREVEAKVWWYRSVKRGRVHLTISGWWSPSQEYVHWLTVQGKCIMCLCVPGIVLGSRDTTKDRTDKNVDRVYYSVRDTDKRVNHQIHKVTPDGD